MYVTSPIPMMLLYGELKRDGTVVTIDGHGADELFGGYTFGYMVLQKILYNIKA